MFIFFSLATGPGSLRARKGLGNRLAARLTAWRRWGWETWALCISGLLTAALGAYAILGVELRPCSPLDLRLKWSGCTRVLVGHTEPVYDVAFSPDGSLLVTGSSDGTAQLWQVEEGVPLHTLRHDQAVTSVTFSPDGAAVASGAVDGSVRLWRVSNGALLRSLEGHKGPVESVAFSPDGSTLATASVDETVRVWLMNDGENLHTLDHEESATSVAFSPEGSLLAVGTGEGKVRLWRFSDGKPSSLRTWQAHSWPVTRLAFSPDGVLLSAEAGTVRLWDTEEGALVHTLDGAGGWLSADGATVVTSRGDGVALWRVADGKLLRTVRIRSTGNMALAPDGKMVAVGFGEWDRYGAAWLYRIEP